MTIGWHFHKQSWISAQTMQRILMLTAVLVTLLPSAIADAHSLRTAYVELVESTPGLVSGTFKRSFPNSRAWLEIDGCTAPKAPQKISASQSAYVKQIQLVCDGSLAGRPLSVHDQGLSIGDIVIRVQLEDDTTASHVLSARQETWVIPKRQSTLEAIANYIPLGIKHISSGMDHLLFVLGLLLLIGAQSAKRLLATITSFTVAHSLTLGAATLELIRVNPAVADACIALSLVLLAVDIGRHQTSRAHLPWMAFIFGLVHGMGFASALRGVGLPQDAVIAALAGVNFGVEIGQLMFICALLVLAQLGRYLPHPMKSQAVVHGIATYTIGILGVFWTLQRWQTLLID